MITYWLYMTGMLITAAITLHSDVFRGMHREHPHVNLNLFTFLCLLCILFWPATWTSAIIITLLEKKR